MPPLLASSQTEKVIDCSVGARSSPDPVRAQVEVQNTPPLDLVEDSMKDIIPAGAAVVPTPQPTSLDDDDELYTVTPQANKARACSLRKMTTQSLAIEAPDHSRSANGTSESSHLKDAFATHRDAPLLTKTAKSAQALAPKTSGSMETPAAQSKKVPLSIKNSSRSSLAALRARTGGQSASVQGDFAANSGPAPKALKPSQAFRSIDAKNKANHPTKTSTTEVRAQTNAPSTLGKLRSRNSDAQRQAPASSTRSVAGYQPETTATQYSHSRSSGADQSVSPRKRRDLNIPIQSKQSKRRADTVEQNAKTHEDVYDLPESPSVNETLPPNKKSRNATRLEPKETAKPSRSSATLKNSRAKSSAAPNSQKHKSRDSAGPNVRTRMMAARSTAPQDEAARRSANGGKALIPASNKARSAKKSANDEGPVEETLVGFEQSVVNYDAETPEKEHHENNLDAKELQRSNVDKDNAPKDAKEITSHVDGKSPVIAASQENQIVLSDRQEPSSPPPSSAQGKSMLFPATTKLVTSHSGIQAPKTPVPYPSSPPANGNLDNSAPRKSTIVAFAKSGPRNQGRPSAQMLVPDSVDSTSEVHSRSSVPAGDVTWPQAKHRKGPASITTSVTSGRYRQSVVPSIVADDVSAALSDFTRKPKEGRKSVLDRSPPNRPQNPGLSSPAKGDDQFVNISDFHAIEDAFNEPVPSVGGGKATGRQFTASQQAMPPPPSKSTLQRKSDPAIAAAVVHQNDEIQPYQGVKGHALPLKRALDVGVAAERPSPKRFRAETFEPDSSSPIERKSSSPAKDTHVQPDIVDAALPPPDASRKPARVASYGSQKVDFFGSPVPEGMIVPELSTALETYSQNVPLPSSAADTDFNRALGSRSAAEDGSPKVTKHLIPSRFQDGTLSSNLKPGPAPPHEASRAVTGFASTDDNEELVGRAKALPKSNPFTKAEQPLVASLRKHSSSTFVDQLKRISAEAQGQAKIHSLKDVSPQRVNRSVVQTNKLLRVPKRTRSPAPSPSPSDSSTDSDESTSSENDLALWRNGLQPHQMNLFDELVIVSHRLVRHLVDAETAALQIVEDYRTRGVALVEQMEGNHIQQRQKYIEKMTARRKKVRKQLSGYNRYLQEIRDNVPRRAHDHAPNKSEEEEKLLRIMAEYC